MKRKSDWHYMPYQLIIEIERPGSYCRFSNIDDFIEYQAQAISNCPTFLASSLIREVKERVSIEKEVEALYSLPANSLKGTNLLFSSPEQAISKLTGDDFIRRLAHSSTLVHIAVSQLQRTVHALVISKDRVIRREYSSNSFPLPGL